MSQLDLFGRPPTDAADDLGAVYAEASGLAARIDRASGSPLMVMEIARLLRSGP